MALVSISHVGGALRGQYVLEALSPLWTEMGLRVETGPRFSDQADVCILHHDRTVVDPAAIPPAPSSAPVLNRQVLDISKRRYSGLRLLPDHDWTGPVIVKTNLNSFGGPERRGNRRRLLHELQKLLARRSWRFARTLPKGVYPVLESIGDVPAWVWQREDLLVERFMPEREGDLYCLRGWLFFGEADYGYRLYATHPMVKTGTMVRYDYLEEAPPELMEHRRAMKFDFGKFDYVVHDGRAILLDANKTPTFGGDPRSERLRRLASGIGKFLP